MPIDKDKIRDLASRIRNLGDDSFVSGMFGSGGGIHIKPSHRGRLTELKERTGKSEDELYSDGNPAHKKMVVFARNARKWKHSDGGYLDSVLPLTDYEIARAAINEVRNKEVLSNRFDGETEDTQHISRFPVRGLRGFGYTGPAAPGLLLSGYLAGKLRKANNTEEESVSDILTEDKRAFAVNDIKRRLLELENSKDNPEGGWNEKEKRWYPHKSHEGGAKTIAYGIKLSSGLPWAKTALKQGYLTDEQALEALDDMSSWYYDRARDVYDKRFGVGKWDELNGKQQSILTDYEYNVKGGLGTFKNLMDATYTGDIDRMLKESTRRSGNLPMHTRNRSIAKDIDSLREHYPVQSRVLDW